MKEGMEEEPHKEGDGNPPKERGKKCDKFGKAVRQKSIAPKLDPEQRLEKGRGDKLDRRGEKGGGEEIGQISQNRLTAKDRVSEKPHVGGRSEQQINEDESESVNRADRKKEKSSVVRTSQKKREYGFPKPAEERKDDAGQEKRLG
jgi:hypothetical protein